MAAATRRRSSPPGTRATRRTSRPSYPETLSWTPVDHASYYEVWIGTDVNFSPGTYDICYTNRTTVTPVPAAAAVRAAARMPIDDGTIYYWRVRGIDGGANVIGLWSALDAAHTYRFIFATPETTLLTARRQRDGR